MEQTLKRVPQASEKGGTLSRIFTTRSFSMLRYILLLAALQAANCFPLSTPVARAPASNSLALTCQLRDVQPEVSRRALLGSALVFGTGFLSAQPAAADMTLNSFKRAYFRYVPRIEQGRDFYVLSLRKLIELGKWDEVKKLYELTSVAQEESTKKQLGLDVKETELTRQLLLPLEVFITSFAEKGTSPKQRKMEAQLNILKKATEDVNANVGNKEAALEAWEVGRKAFNEYVKIANKGMTLQVRQLDPIPEDVASYAATKPRPLNTYSQVGKATQEFQYCEGEKCQK